jgi:hypothetical protein
MGEDAKLHSEREALTFGGLMLEVRALTPLSFAAHALGMLATSPQKLESLHIMSLGVKINDMSSLLSGLFPATGVSTLSILSTLSISSACEGACVDCGLDLDGALLASLDRYASGEPSEGAAVCNKESRAEEEEGGTASLSLCTLSDSLLPTSAEIWHNQTQSDRQTFLCKQHAL